MLGKNLYAAVAGTGGLFLEYDRLLLSGEGSGNLLFLLDLDLGWDALGCAVDDAAVLDKALDHPVACSWAMDAELDTVMA